MIEPRCNRTVPFVWTWVTLVGPRSCLLLMAVDWYWWPWWRTLDQTLSWRFDRDMFSRTLELSTSFILHPATAYLGSSCDEGRVELHALAENLIDRESLSKLCGTMWRESDCPRCNYWSSSEFLQQFMYWWNYSSVYHVSRYFIHTLTDGIRLYAWKSLAFVKGIGTQAWILSHITYDPAGPRITTCPRFSYEKMKCCAES